MSIVIKHNSKLWERRGETKSYFLFWCPGCGCGHLYWCGPGFEHSQKWDFNGNVDKPTFTPSLRTYVRITKEIDDKLVDTGEQKTLCHLNLTDGQLQYCEDNPHKMNNQTIPMQDIPEDYGF